MIRCYLRVSTDEQADSGLGIGAQGRALRDRYATELASNKLRFSQEAASAKDLERRPVLCELLGQIEPGDTLAVAKLDRLTRSVVDFGQLVEAAKDGGWYIVALDLGVDTSTPTGGLVANIMVSVAQWEREIIGERTRLALAEARENGQTLGRPVEVSDLAVQTIRALRGEGFGFRWIARKLNEDRVPAPRGECWYPSTVKRIVERTVTA